MNPHAINYFEMVSICQHERQCESCQVELVCRSKHEPIQDIDAAFYSLRDEVGIETVPKHLAKNFVYFISDGEYVKIGRAVSPVERLREMQVGNALKLSIVQIFGFRNDKECIRAENYLQHWLSKYHVHGEWFRIKGLGFLTGDMGYDMKMKNTLEYWGRSAAEVKHNAKYRIS